MLNSWLHVNSTLQCGSDILGTGRRIRHTTHGVSPQQKHTYKLMQQHLKHTIDGLWEMHSCSVSQLCAAEGRF
jgi:hypothetical protein